MFHKYFIISAMSMMMSCNCAMAECMIQTINPQVKHWGIWP